MTNETNWTRKIEAIRNRPLDLTESSPDEILAVLTKARGVKDAVILSFPENLRVDAAKAFNSAIKQMEQMHIAALDRVDLERRAARVPDTVESIRETVKRCDDLSEKVVPFEPDPADVAASIEIIERVLPEARENVFHEIIETAVEIDGIIACAKAVIAHFGKFKSVHPTIVALQEAVEAAEAV